MPTTTKTRRIAAVALTRRPALELRIAGVRVASNPGDIVEFDGDWPIRDV